MPLVFLRQGRELQEFAQKTSVLEDRFALVPLPRLALHYAANRLQQHGGASV